MRCSHTWEMRVRAMRIGVPTNAFSPPVASRGSIVGDSGSVGEPRPGADDTENVPAATTLTDEVNVTTSVISGNSSGERGGSSTAMSRRSPTGSAYTRTPGNPAGRDTPADAI